MTELAVMVDGPARGQVLVVPSWQRQHGQQWRVAREQPPIAEYLLAGKLVPQMEFDEVVYRFTDFAFFGRTVLVGSVAQPPDSEDCFTALCSDAAKRSALTSGPRPR